MDCTFKEALIFTRKWKELGLTAVKGIGKRDGARVIYVDIELKETIYFINVYTKNEKHDLMEEEKEHLEQL